jgi:xanthine dehydrogenase accessory factor
MQNPVIMLAEAVRNNQPAVLVTVVETSGASPAKAGAQLVMLSDGTQAGTVGGGKLEASILADAQKSFEDRQPRLCHYRLAEDGDDAIGTWCGGEVRAFIQPYIPPPRLVIVGGGHIGRPLEVMGVAAGFDVCVVDVEPGRADLPAIQQAQLSGDSYVILITTDHISDEAALRVALKSSAPYIGMIGSLAKCRMIFDHLLADGIAPGELERVYAPIGLDLGCNSPQEIAVAILAEVVGVRWKKISGKHPVMNRRLEPAGELANPQQAEAQN